MGSCVAQQMKDYGASVSICDRREEAAKETAQRLGATWMPMSTGCADSDVVVVCVPMNSLVQTCLEVSGKMKKDSMLIEISSVKSHISDVLSKALPEHISYVSLHPLFGPEITSLKGQNIVAVRTRSRECTGAVASFLRSKGAEVTILDAKDHDYAMAVFQALHHFLLLSLARAIGTLLPERLMKRELVTNSLRSTLELEVSMLRNLPTIIEVQRTNPFSEEVRRRLINEAQTMLEEDPDVLNQKLVEAAEKISTLL